ncbi:MAG: EAL domain-containing protein [Ideonella sp.]|nr:EAL domain-containing protein [Ideonella sp.]
MTERRYTILVVDDDADARMVMRAALRKAGFDVRMAEGGQDALRQFRSDPCDLVMLDVDMPDLGGHEVCAILRAEAGPLLPIVMVTGMDDVASVETAYQHGATDFIAKPVHWALLGHRVRYIFRSHQAMLDLRAAEARNAAVLNAIPDLLFEVDIDGRYLDYRAPRADLLAAPAETLIGRTVAEVMPPAAAEVCMAALHSALENGFSSGAQIELQLAVGSTWFEMSVSRKSVNAGEKPRFIVLSRDITARKVAEAHVARLAYYDSLTGLPNRQSFLDRVDREILRSGQQSEKLAVLFMDLDGFKTVNDTLGHATGDLILQWAADRLRDGLRPADLLSRPTGFGDFDRADPKLELARLGGDEFTALLLNIEHPDDAVAVAQRIGKLMRKPFVVDGRDVMLSTSIGIALYPEDGADGVTLLKHADTAMYHAKNSGRDNAQVYSASLTREILQRLELDAHLRAALGRNEFHLVYQPQVDVVSGRIYSVEALIRWNHPTRGLVSPLEFIPLAEENGLIERIGNWVLETASVQAACWHKAGLSVSIAVNLSPLQFGTPDLPRMVMQALAKAGLAPQHLELEVTESALMENSVATRAALQALRAHGVRIALDDFGTGYSSLAYLTRMPISHIKVDRCFVTGLLEGGESEAIVRAVLAMARSLGMRVTAEGVESVEQARALKAMACDSLQGYYFSRPVSADDIPALLSRHWALGTAGPAGGDDCSATQRRLTVVR